MQQAERRARRRSVSGSRFGTLGNFQSLLVFHSVRHLFRGYSDYLSTEVAFAQHAWVFLFDVCDLFLGTLHISDDRIIVTIEYFSNQLFKRSSRVCFCVCIGNVDFALVFFDQGCMCVRVALTLETSRWVFEPGCELLRRS